MGWLDDTLKVRVRAKREKGKANTAVERLLADALGLTRGNIRISSGMTSSRKLVEIRGLVESEVYDRLAGL